MANYLIYSYTFSYKAGGEAGYTENKAQLRTLFIGPKLPLSVAVVKAQSKVVELPEGDRAHEKSILLSFGREYMLQYEKLSPREYQVFAIEKSLVSEIHNSLVPQEINLVTPYICCIRSYLMESRVGLRPDVNIIFIDVPGGVEKNLIYMSSYSGQIVHGVRTLQYNFGTLASEIFRTRQSFKAGNKFRIATNCSNIADYLTERGTVERDDLLLFNEPYPAIKSMEVSFKRLPRFVFEEDILRKQEYKERKKALIGLGVSAVVLFIALAFFLRASSFKATNFNMLKSEKISLSLIESQHVKLNSVTYRSQLEDKKQQEMGKKLSIIQSSIPVSFIFDSFVLAKADNRWKLTVYLIKKDISANKSQLSPLFTMYPSSSVENVLVRNQPGYKILFFLD